MLRTAIPGYFTLHYVAIKQQQQHTHLTTSFPGQPGQSGTRKVKYAFWI